MVLSVFTSYPILAKTIIIIGSCEIRNSSDWKTSKKIGVANQGEKFDVLGEDGDYALVQFGEETGPVYNLKGEKINDGCVGYLWTKGVEISDNKIVVLKKDLFINYRPNKKSMILGVARAGSWGWFIKLKTTWYKINKSGKYGWVSNSYVKINR